MTFDPNSQHPSAASWHELLDRGDVIILDTETTGLGPAAEIVEIAAIDTAGEVLLDQPVMPKGPIPAKATECHGWTRDRLQEAGAPTFPEVFGRVDDLVADANLVLTYNAKFDMRMIRQSLDAWEADPQPHACRLRCLMAEYANLRKVPRSDNLRDWKWHKLQPALEHETGCPVEQQHRALADCRQTLELMRLVACRLRGRELPPAQPGIAALHAPGGLSRDLPARPVR